MEHRSKATGRTFPWRDRFRKLARVVSAAAALGLLAGSLEAVLDAVPASAAAVSGVTFSGSSMAAGATNTTWTVSFTPATPLTDADTIFVTFAGGFIIPVSPAVTFGAGFSCTPTTGSTSGQTVSIKLSGLGCTFGSSGSVSISGITNPTAAGSYANTSFSVATSVDSPGSPSANVVITGVQSVVFSGSSMLGGATNTTWTIGFNAGGGSSGPDTIVVLFASEFGIPASPTVVLGTAFTGCTGSTTASTKGTTVTISVGTGCALAADVSATLTIAGITNPPAGSYASSLFSVTADGQTAGSPAANVIITASFNGSGTMSVSPTSVPVGSSGDTFVFTYTAALGGLDSGQLEMTVPTGWSAPSVSASAPGYTTSTCGTVSVGSASIDVSGVTLASGGSCTITYGSQAGNGPGVFAPSIPSTYSFSTLEMSSQSGVLTPLANSPTLSTGTPSLTQIYGTDAVGTAIAVSQAEFPTAGSARAVVLARSDFFSDALAGGPLAAQEGGPLLITPGASITASLDPRVLAEIQRVLPAGGTVFILGGTLALSPNIDATLEGAGYNVVREAGVDEYATAVDIAEQLGDPTTIFEATGLDFYDALSAVPAAIEEHGAILLTNGSSQSLETYAYIIEHLGDTRYAIGGPLAAAGADAGATPIYGQDEFNTSAAVASFFFPHASMFGAATAADFPDALAGGVFMATGDRLGPILLVNPGAPLPVEITPYLASLAIGTKGFVFGGPLAVGPDVVTALQLAVG
jgi:hypothetical protein